MMNKMSDNLTLKRIISFIIDWFIGGMLISIPALLMYSKYGSSEKLYTDLYSFQVANISLEIIYLTGVFCLLVAFIYYFIIPWKIFKGQTLGKKIMHIEMINYKGKNISFFNLFIRQFICIIIFEGASVGSAYLRQMVTLGTMINMDSPWVIVSNMLCIVSLVFIIINSKGRTIHDFLSGTMVIIK